MQQQATAAGKALAIGFVILFGGFALASGIVGLLYLWPAFDPFGFHPHSYPERMLWALAFLVGGAPFAGWVGIVWRSLRVSPPA